MLAMLQEAAKQSGRTLNEEIIRRVSASFSSAPEPQPDTRPVAASDIRQIVREEIAAALSPEVRITDGFGNPMPVQIFGRDHLPS